MEHLSSTLTVRYGRNKEEILLGQCQGRNSAISIPNQNPSEKNFLPLVNQMSNFNLLSQNMDLFSCGNSNVNVNACLKQQKFSKKDIIVGEEGQNQKLILTSVCPTVLNSSLQNGVEDERLQSGLLDLRIQQLALLEEQERKERVKQFPSSRIQTSGCFNADTRPQHPIDDGRSKSMEGFLVQQTSQLLGQISSFFQVEDKKLLSSGIHTKDRHQACVEPYYMDFLAYELSKECRYYSIFTENLDNNPEVNVKCRLELIHWITACGYNKLNVTSETIHLAVFIIHAFLQRQKITLECVQLLGATALFIAAKKEEVSPPEISKFLRQCNFFYYKKEVKWMERVVLAKLKFDLCPPTSQFFMQLCCTQLDFPCSSIKRLITDLSTAILLGSLADHFMTPVFGSLKAKAALEIATEYVLHTSDFFTCCNTSERRWIDDKCLGRCLLLMRQLLLSENVSSHTQS